LGPILLLNLFCVFGLCIRTLWSFKFFLNIFFCIFSFLGL
jgi:hypothetical protein